MPKDKSAADKNLHKSHRERMRERYLKYGLDIMYDHEMIEMLLFSVYPRRNTNHIAHRLMRRFGSVDGIFEASVEELMKVDGVGKTAAEFIARQGELLREFSKEREPAPMREVGMREYAAEISENSPAKCIFLILIRDGQVKSRRYLTQKCADYAFLLEHTEEILELTAACNAVIIVHKSPKPIKPAPTEWAAMQKLYAMLKKAGITVRAHYCVTGGECVDVSGGEPEEDEM